VPSDDEPRLEYDAHVAVADGSYIMDRLTSAEQDLVRRPKRKIKGINKKSKKFAKQLLAVELYSNSAPEARATQQYFGINTFDDYIDHEKIKYVKEGLGITGEKFLKGKMSHELTQRVNYIKAKHVTDRLLKNWSADEYFEKHDKVLTKLPKDSIERIHANNITVEEFLEKYEKGSKPVIITGASDDWPAHEKWSLKGMLERFGDSKFKVGETDHGNAL